MVEQVSLDLQAAFPESKGFSVSNLRYMRQWYYFYTSPEALEKLPQLGRELQDIEEQEDVKHQQLVGEIGDTKLSQVGREIDDPKLQQAVGELSEGVPFPVTFALVPWGHHIEIMAKSKSIDEALFYIQYTINRGWSRSVLMNCMKADLKTVPFQPEFAGKLNFYVSAVDDLIKTPTQNPTIGLLICSNKEETEVQYAFRNLQTPIGVASYDNVQIKQIEAQLPSVEELKRRIRLLEEELAKKNNTL